MDKMIASRGLADASGQVLSIETMKQIGCYLVHATFWQAPYRSVNRPVLSADPTARCHRPGRAPPFYSPAHPA